VPVHAPHDAMDVSRTPFRQFCLCEAGFAPIPSIFSEPGFAPIPFDLPRSRVRPDSIRSSPTQSYVLPLTVWGGLAPPNSHGKAPPRVQNGGMSGPFRQRIEAVDGGRAGSPEPGLRWASERSVMLSGASARRRSRSLAYVTDRIRRGPGSSVFCFSVKGPHPSRCPARNVLCSSHRSVGNLRVP
jgi:hypothetical protein